MSDKLSSDAEAYAERFMPDALSRFRELEKKEQEMREVFALALDQFQMKQKEISNYENKRFLQIMGKWEKIGVSVSNPFKFGGLFTCAVDHEDIEKFYFSIIRFGQEKFFFPKNFYASFQSNLPIQRLHLEDEEELVFENFVLSKSIDDLLIESLHVLVGDTEGHENFESALRKLRSVV